MPDDQLEALFTDSRRNALVGWLIVILFVGAIFESLTEGDWSWLVVVLTTLVVVIVPPILRGSPWVMVPWELLAIASIPISLRTIGVTTTAPVVTYLSIAALALLISAELHVFGPITITHWFAVVSVAMTTLAVAGLWAVLRFHLDRWLGTATLVDNTALMIEFAWAAVAGVLAGGLFAAYFHDRVRHLRRRDWEGPS